MEQVNETRSARLTSLASSSSRKAITLGISDILSLLTLCAVYIIGIAQIFVWSWNPKRRTILTFQISFIVLTAASFLGSLYYVITAKRVKQRKIRSVETMEVVLAFFTFAIFVSSSLWERSIPAGETRSIKGIETLHAVALVLMGIRFYLHAKIYCVVDFKNCTVVSDQAETDETKGGKSAGFHVILYKAMRGLWRQGYRLGALFLCMCITSAQSPLTSFFVGQALGTTMAPGIAIVSIVVVNVVAIAAYAAVSFLFAKLSSVASRELQDIMARKALHIDYDANVIDMTPGRLSSGFSQGLAKLQVIWSITLWGGVVGFLNMFVNYAFIFATHPIIGLVLASFVPIMYCFHFLKEQASEKSVEFTKCLGELQAYLQNFLNLRQSARLFDADHFLIEEIWSKSSSAQERALYKTTLWAAIVQTALSSVGFISSTVALALVIILNSNETLSQAQAVAMFGYIAGAVGPIAKLANWNEKLIWAAGSINDVYEICYGDNLKVAHSDDDIVEIAEHPEQVQADVSREAKGLKEIVVDCQNSNPAEVLGARAPTVQVNGLTVTYPSNETATLDNLSLLVKAKEYVALVGSSGSGKTTLLRLMANILSGAEPDNGQILIEGVSNKHYRQSAMVLQHAEVLDGTVKENISFGAPVDSLQDLIEIAKLAELHDTIMNLPNQYDTLIGDQSDVKLSGGQLARLSLARALYRRPKLLLIDEITSPLSAELESSVLTTLRKLHDTTEITIILCTHSLFAMQSVDKIFVLDQGHLEERGSFSQLIGHRGALYNIVKDKL